MKQTTFKFILLFVGLLMCNEKMAAQEPEEKAVWTEPFELVFREYEDVTNEKSQLMNDKTFTDNPSDLLYKGACYVSTIEKNGLKLYKTAENGLKMTKDGTPSFKINLSKPIYIERVDITCKSNGFNLKIGTKTFSASNDFQTVSNSFEGSSTPQPLLSKSLNITIDEGAVTGYIKSIKIYPQVESVTISNAEFTTYVSTLGLDFTDTDLNAYVISSIEEQESLVKLKKVDKIKQGNAVIINGRQGTYKINTTPSSDITAQVNHLKFSTTEQSIDGNLDYYILAAIDGQVGFAAVTEETIPDRKGYFTLPKSANIKEFKFAIDNEETSIDIPKVDNGHNSQSFNLSGQRVGDNYKGIIIRNGKKYLKR